MTTFHTQVEDLPRMSEGTIAVSIILANFHNRAGLVRIHSKPQVILNRMRDRVNLIRLAMLPGNAFLILCNCRWAFAATGPARDETAPRLMATLVVDTSTPSSLNLVLSGPSLGTALANRFPGASVVANT